jgi:hypothetical protein
MGVPYSVTVFIRESRAKIEAKSKGKVSNGKTGIMNWKERKKVSNSQCTSRTRIQEGFSQRRLLADQAVALASGIDGEAATKRPIRQPA